MLAIDGFGTVGRSNTYQPFADRDPERNYNVNASWLRGTHNIRFGFDSDFQDSNEMQYEMTGSSYNTSAGGFHFAPANCHGYRSRRTWHGLRRSPKLTHRYSLKVTQVF